MDTNGGRKDSLSKDDASIETVSESGDSFDRDWEVQLFSPGRSSVAASDADSMDFQKLSIHSKMATIVLRDGRQFIERRDADDGGLGYSAEFDLNGEVWKLNGEDCLLMSQREYIAKVRMAGSPDLEEYTDFEEAVRVLLKHLKVVKVFQDEQLDDCLQAKKLLRMILEQQVGKPEDVRHRRDLVTLRSVLQRQGDLPNSDFMHELKKRSNLLREIKVALENYVTKAVKLIQRNEILGGLNDSSLSLNFINGAVEKAIAIHRARLMAFCPSIIMDELKKLPDDAVLYLSTDDIHLFADLTTLDQPLLDSVIPMMFSKFVTKAQDNQQVVEQIPLANQLFPFICKSLFEVAEQLGTHIGSDSVIFYNEKRGWQVSKVRKEKQTTLSYHLRKQLLTITALANHFEPGGPFRTSCFPYKFKFLPNMDVVPEPVRIWLYLLDDAMKSLVHTDSDKMQMLSCFFGSFVNFIAAEEFDGETLECLRKITHQALRSMVDKETSHEEDEASSNPFSMNFSDMIDGCLDEFFCEHFAEDCEQIKTTLRQVVDQVMNKHVPSEELTEFCHVFKQLLKDLSDLPLEWYVYLPSSENRKLLLRGQFVVVMDNRWKGTEHECLRVVDPDGFVKVYKLLYDTEELPNHFQLKAIRVMVDKLTENQSGNGGKHRSKKHQLRATIDLIDSTRDSILYLSKQPDFSCFELYLRRMSEMFNRMTTKNTSPEVGSSTVVNRWQASDSRKTSEASNPTTTKDKSPEVTDRRLTTTNSSPANDLRKKGQVVNSITTKKNSPEVVDEKLSIASSSKAKDLRKTGEVFNPVTTKDRSPEVVDEGLSTTSSSKAKDLRKTDEVVIRMTTKDATPEVVDSGLTTANSSQASPSKTGSTNSEEASKPLPDSLESSSPAECSMTAIDRYFTQFSVYLSETVELPKEKRIEQIVSAVKSEIKPQPVTTWTEELQRNELPMVLAGLGAVWSLIVPETESGGSEKSKHPSPLQIDCVLELFDNQKCNEGDLNRLLYLSSQQGKDAVLGLTAALLALYDNDVLIVCYNSDLYETRSFHLTELFEKFSVQDIISFGSLEDVAREASREVFNKCAAAIYSKVGIKTNNPDRSPSKPVLLIEDVDLLLQSKTLGQCFKRFITPTIPGLALIQEKFFCSESPTTLYDIDPFIKESNDPKICKLRTFLSRPTSYTLLEVTPSGCKEISYTNKTLFDSHIKRFDKNLCHYFKKPTNLRLSSNGVVTATYIDEYNVEDLRYFRFKATGFRQRVDHYKNYGFLTLGFVPFPYAHLLKKFPMVFGFATAPLDGYEELALHDHYGIHHPINKYNPTETSPVKFDPKKDFRCVDDTNKWDWKIAVMVAINAAIGKDYSLQVFFKNEQVMEEFREKFKSHLDKLHAEELTTASNETSLSAVTYALDEVCVMIIDRNEDLACSTEDRHIHVIQTFFSYDEQEENLIRKQAERVHGRSSYELIVSKNDLLVSCSSDEVTYEMAVKSRMKRSFGNAMSRLEESTELYNQIQKFYDKS